MHLIVRAARLLSYNRIVLVKRLEKKEKNSESKGDFKMIEFLQGTLGTIFYTIVTFVAGALIGKPLFAWVNEKMPWNK